MIAQRIAFCLRLAVVLIGIALLLFQSATASAQEPLYQAGLVIQYEPGQVDTACVAFGEPSISGMELLERSGFGYIAQQSGAGVAVCKIGPQGCDYPAENCFCERDGPQTIYWAYYVQAEGQWRYANVGAAAAQVQNGTVQGWAWGLGESGQGAVPPLLGIDAICGVAAAPSPEPAPSALPPSPLPTPSPIPPTAAPAPSPPPATLTPLPSAQPSSVPAASQTGVPTSLPSPSASSQSSAPLASSTAKPAGGAAPTIASTPESAVAEPTTSGSLVSYLGYGVIICLLLGGIFFSLQRRRL